MTRIYQIVQHTFDKSIYISFYGCNFKCLGCLLKDSVWYYHLPEDLKRCLEKLGTIKFLPLSELKSIVEELDTKMAILGGAEPTLDKELPEVVGTLSDLGVKTHLTTNGYALDQETIKRLKRAGLSSVCISIRAYDYHVHRFYTGRSNRRVLNNFKLAYESGMEVMAESILIPGLIEIDEIERIAKFIASVDPSIKYRIDGFITFDDLPWRSPSPEEVVRAAQAARRHLNNVYYLHKGMKFEGNVINIYPGIPYWQPSTSPSR